MQVGLERDDADGGSIAYGGENRLRGGPVSLLRGRRTEIFDTLSEGITYLERLDVEAVLKVRLGTLPA